VKEGEKRQRYIALLRERYIRLLTGGVGYQCDDGNVVHWLMWAIGICINLFKFIQMSYVSKQMLK